MKFRTSRDKALVQPFVSEKPSLTVQSFGYETDINNIVQGCGSSFPSRQIQPQTEIGHFKPGQYEEAMMIAANARSQFEELPSDVRLKFNNDPGQLINFLNDSKNDDEAVKLGLKEYIPQREPIEVRMVQDAPVGIKETSNQTADAVTPPEGST